MNRPWHIWSVFGICLVVLLAAMAWVSLAAVRLDRAQQEGAQQAEVEERARLALWRMDSTLGTLIVEESSRPYYSYDSFHAADRAYTKAFSSIKQGDVLVPSPLLGYLPANVLVHFQLDQGGNLTSPQVPLGNERTLAETGYTTSEKIEQASARLAELKRILGQPAGSDVYPAASSSSHLFDMSRGRENVLSNEELLDAVCVAAASNAVEILNLGALPGPQQSRQSPQGQMLRNSAEWNARANVSQQQAGVNEPAQVGNYVAPSELNPGEAAFKAVWLGPALVLARRVTVNGRALIQGCWLDWEKLRASLNQSVRDLFPASDLQPVHSLNRQNKDPRRLAALPARLITGPVAIEPIPFWSPIRLSLVVAWCCVSLAALAVAVLLHGAVSLSERRGAFVSAVTHELRTPLTTFKMYSEMLAQGMVADEEKQRNYLNVLCTEANRLTHLVENVLAYARLERAAARGRIERVTLETLVERVKERLAQRAEQAGMRLVIELKEEALKTALRIDVSAVEQILFNLVDNACKYAAAASQKLIHLQGWPERKSVLLCIRDHGPGISAAGARRLFRPFCKSAQEAAHTAPGVGLGLALCRRLIRSMGGDLRLDHSVKDGACFVLVLPGTLLDVTQPP